MQGEHRRPVPCRGQGSGPLWCRAGGRCAGEGQRLEGLEGGPDGHPHFEFRRQSVFPNFYYFYLYDQQFGPAFIKVSSYAPFSMWVGCNGHEWAKRHLEQGSISYVDLDNGFAACDDPARLQKICDRFGASAIRTFFERWVHRLPSPFTAADHRAGFSYDLAFRQIEFSDTRSSTAQPLAGHGLRRLSATTSIWGVPITCH